VSRPGYAYRLREPVGYEEGWELQRRIADSVARGALPDTVLLLEHSPVITLGRRTEPGELHVPEGAEVEIVETDRGGKSTYHGPGQLVCYPIFDLTRHGFAHPSWWRMVPPSGITHRCNTEGFGRAWRNIRTRTGFRLQGAQYVDGMTKLTLALRPIFQVQRLEPGVTPLPTRR